MLLHTISALSSVGRRANYAAVVERLKAEHKIEEGISIEEMKKMSKEARKQEQLKNTASNKTKNKNKSAGQKFVTKVYTTRRKKIVKKRRVGKF